MCKIRKTHGVFSVQVTILRITTSTFTLQGELLKRLGELTSLHQDLDY